MLQRWLQYRAVEDGVDLTDHAQWDGWLKGAVVPAVDASAGPTVIPLSMSLDND